MVVKSISPLKRWSFCWWEFMKNVHCDARCDSSQFAIHDSREIDFEQFAMRAKDQHYKVHPRSLECARSALCPPTE